MVEELNKILWETEKELLKIKNESIEKDNIIKELRDELYISDLEIIELRHILENAYNVKVIHNMLCKISELNTIIKDLRADMYMNELELNDMKHLIDQSENAQYLQQLNDRNDKLMKVNRHLMENIYKSKVLYM